MKKITLSLFTFIVCISAFGQTANYSFSWWGDPPTCNPFVGNSVYLNQVATLDGFDYWKASHGSPSLTGSQGQYNIGVLDVSYNRTNDTYTSEGIFIKAPFQEGYYYNLSMTLKLASGFAGLSIYAANGLTERTATTCIQESVPSITDKSLILERQNAPQSSYGEWPSIYKDNFLALKNFNNIWFYTTSNFVCDNTTGKIYILGFYLTKGAPETVPPTIPTGLSIYNKTSTGFTLRWNASTDNIRVKGYEVFVNGVAIGTTTNLNKVITNLTKDQVYTIKVRAFDIVNNFSGFSNEVQTYIAPDLIINGSISIFCNNTSRTFSTTTYPNATYQWSAISGLSLSNTTSSTVTATATASYSGSTTLTLTRTITQNGLPDTQSTSITFWVGTPAKPTYIVGFPNGKKFAPNNEYHFSSTGTYWMVPRGGSILGGQGTTSIDVMTSSTSKTIFMSVASSNSCGLSAYYSVTGSIDVSGQGGFGPPKPEDNEISLKTVKSYPNPTNGIINIELPKSANENSLFEIRVFDMVGKLVLTKSSITGNSKQTIDLSQFNNGNYILIISNSDGLVEKQQINLSK